MAIYLYVYLSSYVYPVQICCLYLVIYMSVTLISKTLLWEVIIETILKWKYLSWPGMSSLPSSGEAKVFMTSAADGYYSIAAPAWALRAPAALVGLQVLEGCFPLASCPGSEQGSLLGCV